MPRIAPKGGYDFSKKRDYRRKVWATFRDGIKNSGGSVASAQALLMPSLEGDEIDVALNAGFREQNLHVVDWEPAVVATLKRRYPKIHTYGVSVSRAFKRLSSDGVRLTCANMDFCGSISRRFGAELLNVALAGSYTGTFTDGGFNVARVGGVFEDECWVSVSTLRGRETADCLNADHYSDDNLSPLLSRITENARTGGVSERAISEALSHWSILDSFSTRDRQRIMWMCEMLCLARADSMPHRPGVQPLRSEFYLSTSGQTMLWCIFKVTSFSHDERMRIAANLKRQRLGMPLMPPNDPYVGLEPEWTRNPMQDERLRSLILRKLGASYLA